jgi:cytoskeletal protein CcmA (bactofilin family)
MKKKLLLILGIMFLFAVNLNAIELKYDDKDLVETALYDEDYMFFGKTLDFQGEARDVYLFGKNIDFSGKSRMALFAFAQAINMVGTSENGIKAAGQNVIVEGNVKGTSFIAAEEVMIDPKSQIDGDTFIGARIIDIKGKMKGDLFAGAAEISIQNEILGDVNVYAGELTIPENGKIVGNLIYHSDKEITAEEASRVSGEITFEKEEEAFFDNNFADNDFCIPLWLSMLFKLSFIIFGLLILLFPATAFLEKYYSHKELLANSLWGLIPIFVYPTAILISIGLLITLPVAISLIFGFIPLALVTKVIGITIIGSFLVKRLNLNISNRFLFFLAGAVLYSLLSLIPFFGFLLLIFVTSIGCGLILLSLFKKSIV